MRTLLVDIIGGLAIWSLLWTSVGFAVTLSVLGKLWVPVEILKLCTLGSLDVVPGESSTQTLFLRVMDTFDDDDDFNTSTLQHFNTFQISR